MNTKYQARRERALSHAGKLSPFALLRTLRKLSLASVAMLLPVCATSQTMQAPDITKTPTLYVVPYAHLDTQWRWEMPQTISEYLLKTMRVNFDYIDRYPHYVFNWTGSNRYRLMKEYYPDDYARIRQYVAAGRWFPAGSSVEEGDVNLPSAEGIFRQILYGNSYFRKDFGKASNEYMLPDCFGFPPRCPVSSRMLASRASPRRSSTPSGSPRPWWAARTRQRRRRKAFPSMSACGRDLTAGP